MPDPSPPLKPTPEQLLRTAELFNESGALRAFGVRISFPTVANVLLTVDPVLPQHRGGLGTDAVNGGVLAGLFDLAIGCTALLIDPTRRSATMQLSMSFERPVRGDRFTVEAEITSAGSKTLYSAARVLDEKGAVCARCQGLTRVSSLPWKGDPAIKSEYAGKP